jgi:hypothetical protein
MSNPTTNLGLRKPLFAADPEMCANMDLIDAAVAGMAGGGAGFSQVKLTFHDSDILNMNQYGSGGLILLPGVANKYYIPLFCILSFKYGGTAFFTGTAFDDLLIYQNVGTYMVGSTHFLFDGSFTNDLVQMMHFRDQATQAFISDLAGGNAVWLATANTPLADGDPGGNSNMLTVTLGYLTYDTVTGVVS